MQGLITLLAFGLVQALEWERLPGTLWKQISVADDGKLVLGVNRNNEIIRFNPDTRALSVLPGRLSSVAACNDGMAYGLAANGDGTIYKSNAPVWGSFSWEVIPGTLKQIECGSGTFPLWGLGTNGVPYFRWNNEWRAWFGNLKQISVTEDQIWGVQEDQAILTSFLPSEGWSRVDGTLTLIAGDGKSAYGTTSNGNLFQYVGNGIWARTAGEMITSMAATANWVYVLAGPDGNFFRSPNFRCNSPKQAVEWREMSPPQQLNYLNAVKCLRGKPSIHGGSTSGYNDFVLAHQGAIAFAHEKPPFLPWHRLFIATFDTALQAACGYNGPFPYWDWSRDSQAPETSSIWDNTYGFGGHSNDCLIGPFAGIQRFGGDPGCVKRTWNGANSPLIEAIYTETQLQFVMNSKSFDEFSYNLEWFPHNSIHSSLGGDMFNTFISVNDPIFFLHHRNVDRLWAVWQARNPGAAFTYTNGLYEVMNMYNLAPNEPIHRILNIVGGGAGGRICYKYSNSILPGLNIVRRADNGVVPALAPKEKSVPVLLGNSTVPVNTNTTVPTNSTVSAPNTVAQTTNNNTLLAVLAGKITNPKSPLPSDRTNMEDIRYVAPLPEAFLKRRKATPEQIKAIRLKEWEIRNITDKLNADPNFTSKFRLSVLLKANKIGWKKQTEGGAAVDAQNSKNAFVHALVEVIKDKKNSTAAAKP